MSFEQPPTQPRGKSEKKPGEAIAINMLRAINKKEEGLDIFKGAIDTARELAQFCRESGDEAEAASFEEEIPGIEEKIRAEEASIGNYRKFYEKHKKDYGV